MKDLIAVKEERARLVQDVHVLKVEKESIALNLKIAEETRENISRDLGELRRERDAAIARYKQAMDDCETLEKKVRLFPSYYDTLKNPSFNECYGQVSIDEVTEITVNFFNKKLFIIYSKVFGKYSSLL